MDATCTIQDSIHVFSLVHKYVSRILGTYQLQGAFYYGFYVLNYMNTENNFGGSYGREINQR